MGLIINIETATDVCSVVLANDGKTLGKLEEKSGQSHARLLTTFISGCMSQAGLQLSDLDAVAVSKGPGSYTGLRIGVSVAKGLCYGLEIPLISVNTLQSMASCLLSMKQISPGTWLGPMIDARRMEVYTAFLNENLEFEKPTSAEIIEPGIFEELLNHHPVIFFGDGMAKTRKYFENHINASFYPEFQPSASGMVQFSEIAYKNNDFEDVAYFEPFYLKNFYTHRQP